MTPEQILPFTYDVSLAVVLWATAMASGPFGLTAMLLALKRRWLALLMPGVLWAFAHAGYTIDPSTAGGAPSVV